MRILTCYLFALVYFLGSEYCEADDSTDSINQLIFHEVQRGDVSKVIKFINDVRHVNPRFRNRKQDNNTALHVAAIKGFNDIAFTLLQHGWSIAAVNDKKMTPLHNAAVGGHERIVEVLLKRGADVNVKNRDGDSPLSLAAIKGHKNVVERLIYYGANITWSDIERSPKIIANLLRLTQKERKEACRDFIENGKLQDTKILIQSEFFHPTHDLEMKHLNWLINTYKPDINTQNDNGDTPLHIAIQNGHLELTKALLRNGVDVNFVNKDGISPLHYAASGGDGNVVNLLIRKGANLNARAPTTASTPLHFAANKGLWSTVYPLLLRGADANAQDAHGYTALHHAVSELDKIGYKKSPSYASYKTVIEILLQSNANRQIKSSAGLLASDMAKDSDIKAIFQKINGPAKNECTKYGSLLSAARRGKRAAYGTFTTSSEFPWMAALGAKDASKHNPRFFCGGTIISDSFVMTAAHCIMDTIEMIVRVGTEFIRKEPSSGRDYDVEKIIRNDYKVDYMGSQFMNNVNDIALLRLRQKIAFSSVISPACLHLDRNELSRNTQMIVTGWGRSERSGVTEQLTKANLVTMPLAECSKWFSTVNNQWKHTLLESQYCAYDPKFLSDSCSGDSGGPLQYFTGSNRVATVLGVVSYGLNACPSKAPGVYCKVAYYIDWIQSHVWPEQTPMKYFTDKSINNLDSYGK